MALKDDKIKDLFSSKLNSFEPEVPASIWGGIDQLLSQQPIATPNSSSQASTAGKTSTLKTTLIAAGVAASIALGVFVMRDSSEVIIPEVVDKAVPMKEVLQPLVPEILKEDKSPVFAQRSVVRAQRQSQQKQILAFAVIEETNQAESVQTKKGPDKIEGKVRKVESKSEVSEFEEIGKLPEATLSKFFTEDVSLGINTNAGAMSSNVNNSGGDLLFSRNERSGELADILRNEDKDYKLTHKQPISVGITASKRLTRNFSFQTGIVFTYLSSKISSNSAVNLKEEQTFGYLGVPIYLNYHFYDWGKANFYLSLGAMIQKDVYGKYTSKLISSGAMQSTSLNFPLEILYAEPAYIRKSISQSNWQFSGHLTLGASYPIYRRLHVYTSIGGAYYFDASNEYRTVYSDREFQLDLNLGLRIDF